MKINNFSRDCSPKKSRYLALLGCYLFFFLALFHFEANAVYLSPDKKATITLKQASLEEVIRALEKQTAIGFMYNVNEIRNVKNLTLDEKDINLNSLLDRVLKGTDLTYSYENNVVVIRKKTTTELQQNETRTIKGKVVDEKKEPIIGVTVLIKGTNLGVATDAEGNFTLSIPSISNNPNLTLVFSYVGMKTQEIKIGNKNQLAIEMHEDATMMEDVVVTGIFDRSKETFTGAAKTITGEQLRQISTTNIFSALSIIDPAVQIRTNNAQGSNPNNLPDIIIRGTSSLNASDQMGANAPLIVIDGVERSIRDLYDMDIYDIESVTTLKDASATALYGEQAANGVIVVTRKKNFQKQVRLSYNFTGTVELPDLRDYDLMDAREKLEFERSAGLYGDPSSENYTGKEYFEEYLPILKRVNSGVNTDWLAKPLRNSFSHNHSLTASGEGSGMSYQLTGNYGSTKGVMKNDLRERIGVGAYFSYNLKQKLIVTARIDYNQTNTDDSNYGSFSEYALANPYDAPYNAKGELQLRLSRDMTNPLYESTLGSFSKTVSKAVLANLNIRWNISNSFYINAIGNINSEDKRSDSYVSPLSNYFLNTVDPNEKGSYTISSSKDNDYNGRLTINYSHSLDQRGTLISLNVGGELDKTNISPYSFTAVGFLNDKLTDITFASQYMPNTRPSGTSSISTKAAFISSGSFTLISRYFIDGSFRLSGSSKFGKSQRYAPFWSTGIGWNIHKETWASNLGCIDIFRLRASYGHTGSLNFAPYQAITTYFYDSSLLLPAGVGANPKTLGNPDLKPQITKNLNLGVTSTFFNSRLDFNFDYYKQRTVDMIVPISMPLSSGVETVSSNIGEQLNKGIEFSLSGVVLKNDNFFWRIGVTGAHNKNELVKIGDVLKRQNETYAKLTGSSPSQLYIEGESTTMIYAVKSAGIDPADGQEIFIKRDGSYTKEYDSNEKIAIGDAEPKLRGAISTSFSYKGFGFNCNALYSLGGYIYNSTRAEKVENIDAKYNADKRAYAKRWEKPGDVVEYVNKKNSTTSQHTSRFVEKENYLSLPAMTFSYQFERDMIRKYGFDALNVSLSINDVLYLSTIAQERGTSYPFARNISFTISTRF